MWLLVIPPLLCILPFIACVSLLLRGRAVTDRSESRLSKTARQFSIPGLIGGAWHVWHDLSGRQKTRVTRSLERFAKRKGHIATILFITISNALMLLLSIVIFVVVSLFLLFNEVNYSWKSSLATTRTKFATIRSIGCLVPFVGPPSDGALDWALGEKHPPESVIDETIHSPEIRSTVASVNTPAAAGDKTEDSLEKPTVSIRATPSEISEDDPSTAARIVVERAGSMSGPLTVQYKVGGSAKPEDYVAELDGSIVIPAEETSTTITITAVDNSTIDGDKVDLVLSPSSNYVVGPQKSVTVTIVENDTVENFRSDWSWFILCTLIVLGIVPRLVIGGLSVYLMRRSWCELMPDSDDQSINKIVGNVMGEKVTSTTETKVPELDESDQAPVLPEPTAVESKPRHFSSRPMLVAYSVAENDISILKQSDACQECDLEVVDGAAARHACIAQLKENSDISRVILLVRATTVPDKAFSSFLSQVTIELGSRNGLMGMVIVGASEHLERVGGDARANRDRLDHWRREAAGCGIKDGDVLVLDLDSCEEKSRLSKFVADSGRTESGGSFEMADKFDQALDHIEKKLRSACLSTAVSTSEDWKAICDQIRDHIANIYESEFRGFLSSITDADWQERASKIAPAIGLPEGVQQTLGKVLAMDKFFKSLSLKWMIAGAIAGVGATAALPLLVGGSIGIPALFAAFPYTTLGGAVSAQGIKTYWQSRGGPDDDSIDYATSYEGLDLDAATRASLLLLVMLEFQNNPHEVIAEKVEQHLGLVGRSIIDSSEKMSDEVSQMRRSLREDSEVFQ